MIEESQAEAQAEVSSQANVDRTPVYEVGFHVVFTVTEGEVPSVVEKIRAELKKVDAELIAEHPPQKITLAYTIEKDSGGKREKFNNAYFGSIKFAAEREHILALTEYLRGAKEILRFLLIETVREVPTVPRRAVFTSDRLEGQAIVKHPGTPEKKGEVSDEELDKKIEELVR